MSLTVLVTGSNRGIGLELCRQYQKAGAKVFAVCRSSSAELDALQVNVLQGIDVSQADAVAKLSEQLQSEKIDILINNAGIFLLETVSDMNFDSIEQQLQVNAIAPLRVTHALMANLNEGAKVALITSRMGSIADNTSGSYYGYRMSKAALNAAGVSMANDLKPRGIAVGIYHPGYVETRMTNFNADISANESASRLLQRIDELDLKNSGGFWHSNGEVLPW